MEQTNQEKEVKLEVNNLRISFRTANGKVQAVRDISFKLYKGETLAIVGESGSGKSVTTRAMLGILAANAIKEGGEIVYDGQDLMKISEEDFHRIRGDKIAMIFQDPLSSLNPIMRVGKQMTEAMLIKGRLSQREARKDFNGTLKRLNLAMNAARGNDAENTQKCKAFNKFECCHLALENAYNRAHEAATDAVKAIDDLVFEIEKHAANALVSDVRAICRQALDAIERYVVWQRADELKGEVAALRSLAREPVLTIVKRNVYLLLHKQAEKAKFDDAEISRRLTNVRDILSEALAFEKPNFFAMGYYLTFVDKTLPDMPVAELNAHMRKVLDERFMLDFIALAKEGLVYSHKTATEKKKFALEVIEQFKPVFTAAELDKKAVAIAAKEMIDAVEAGIDRLEIVKDNSAYTFATSLKSAISQYFGGIVRNEKEEKRYARQMAAYDKKVARGKTPDYVVADKKLVDLPEASEEIVSVIVRVAEDFRKQIAGSETVDFDRRTVDMVDWLKQKASDVAYKVTRSMAKTRALKLLEEVGIPEPRKRYRQYPFEFSGGMRQRIVIAIALSANPDILICDEPTTALDVTIQAQILELINRVNQERQLSVIFITHDLGVVANMADRVAVMYAGKIVEIGTADDVFYSPAHPYTWALLSSMPDLDTKEKLEAIPGTPPNMIYPPKGDAFAERNKYALKIDFEQQPPMFRISDTHYAATWLLHPDAPKIDPPKSVTERIARMKARMAPAPAAAPDEAKEAPADAPKEAAPKKRRAKKVPDEAKETPADTPKEAAPKKRRTKKAPETPEK